MVITLFLLVTAVGFASFIAVRMAAAPPTPEEAAP